MDEATISDVLVVGSGAAGLTVALQLAPQARVTLLSKGDLAESSTLYAQGGIAAVLDATDSTEFHIADTLVAGAGLCDADVVRFVVENAKDAISRLIGYGVEFTRNDEPAAKQAYHLTREGGHSHRRIIHAADATGREVEKTLEERVRETPNIEIFEHHLAIDLVRQKDADGRPGRCAGLYALDRQTGTVRLFRAKAVVLASGGASKVYLYSSNPDACTGDGIAMAWRVGCRVSNLEFMQFHPTVLYHPTAKSFLVSEAVRGEGGRLLLPTTGERFMPRFDERGELAPRDIVARAIDHEMKRLGLDYVHLDISHQPAEFITTHFPTIHAECLRLGIDMTCQPIPVVPAAHYTCGGVMTDKRGRTDVPGLYAVGEVAFTGLHGANRMASNSLLECLVFGASAAADIHARLPSLPMPPALPAWDDSWVTNSDEEVVVSHNWEELRRFMWDYVGIVRTTKRLERAQHRVELLLSEIEDYYGSFRVTNDLLELRNLALVSKLIIRSALARRESRGLHYTLDFPYPDPVAAPQNSILTPKRFRLAPQD